jgi:hypothetical protein
MVIFLGYQEIENPMDEYMHLYYDALTHFAAIHR